MIRYIICVSLFCIGVLPAFAGQGDSKLIQGNRLYHQKKFQDAVRSYADAVALDAHRALYRFNLGDGQYKAGEYPAAAHSFEQALATADKKLEQKAVYNLGNAEFKWGVSQENKDLDKAIELVEHSIRHYTRAIEGDAHDKDAKINRSIAEKKLEELKEKKKKQPPQQSKQQQNKNNQGQQNKQDQQNGQGGKQDQQNGQGQQDRSHSDKRNNDRDNAGSKEKEGNNRNGASEDNAQSKNAGASEPGSSDSRQGEQEKQGNQKEQGVSPRYEHMSKDEANMLLDGYRQEERMFGTIDDAHKSNSEQVAKDW